MERMLQNSQELISLIAFFFSGFTVRKFKVSMAWKSAQEFPGCCAAGLEV